MFARVLLTMSILVASAISALAVCGDVNGDGEKKTSDALAVLKSAVGQPVELQCSCEECGPSTTLPPVECCQGSAVFCSSYPDAGDCMSQPGCSYFMFCIGTPAACSTRASEEACLGVDGCSWGSGDCTATTTTTTTTTLPTEQCCKGSPVACNSFNDSSSCNGQPGCFFSSFFCAGTPPGCATRASEPTCEDIDGCVWGSCSR